MLEHSQALNVTKRKVIPFAQYQARIICADCNRHFGRLEEDVKPVLTRLLDGKRTPLDNAQQRLLSRWAFKTTCALLGVERKYRSVPRRYRLALRKTGRVPVACFVGVGRYTAPAGIRILAGRARLVSALPENKTLSVYRSVFAFGQAVFKVFGVLNPPTEDTFRVPVGRLWQIWPPSREDVIWPPLWPLDDDGVTQLVRFNPFIRR